MQSTQYLHMYIEWGYCWEIVVISVNILEGNSIPLPVDIGNIKIASIYYLDLLGSHWSKSCGWSNPYNYRGRIV